MADRIAGALADQALRPGAPSPEARYEVRRRLIDCLALSRASFGDTAVQKARHVAEPATASSPAATIWGAPGRFRVTDAVFANGVATRYRDMNDAYFGTEALHPSDMIPAMCAVAEGQGVTVDQLLDAVNISYDIAVDLADTWRTASRDCDHVNLIGFGATAGIGRLLGLNTTQLSQALAITASGSIASRECRKGDLSMWKGYAAAHQCVAALRSVRLAAVGIEAPPLAFTGPQGFQAVAVDPAFHIDEWHRPAGDHADRILDTHYKIYPLGYLAQGPVQLAVELRNDVDVRDVAALEIHTYRRAAEIMGDAQKWHPTSAETADHSLPYVTLIGLLDGTVTTDAMRPERWELPDVVRLLPAVSVIVDEEMTAAYPREMAARVEVVRHDGTRASRAARWPRGHAKNPIDDDELLTRSVALNADSNPVDPAYLRRVLVHPGDRPAAELWCDHA